MSETKYTTEELIEFLDYEIHNHEYGIDEWPTQKESDNGIAMLTEIKGIVESVKAKDILIEQASKVIAEYNTELKETFDDLGRPKQQPQPVVTMEEIYNWVHNLFTIGIDCESNEEQLIREVDYIANRLKSKGVKVEEEK